MLAAGHSRHLAKGKAEAHDHRHDGERFHYDDGLNPARGIIAAMLLGMALWWLAWAFL